MSATLGAYEWSTTRGTPTAGQVTYASDPVPGYANTLRISETDRDGNSRAAVLATIDTGDVITIVAERSGRSIGYVTGSKTDSGSYYSFPITIRQFYGSDYEPSDEADLSLYFSTPVEWPDQEALTRVLNFTDDQDDVMLANIDSSLASAIEVIKGQRGYWDETNDVPTANLSSAALRLAQLMLLEPDTSVESLLRDAAVRAYMTGKHRRFAVA